MDGTVIESADPAAFTPEQVTAGVVIQGLASATRADTVAELVDAYWQDNELYCKTFFPNTCRQESAPFHLRIDDALWARRRKVAIKVFRSGAKTSRVRMFLSKRIAFGVSRTILYISKSEATATATLDWLKGQVEKQTHWAQFWGIVKGETWANDEAQFINTVLGVKITVVAVGIHGQIRGLNFDDFRPDLIVCDDIEDEKTTNTKEQIKKHSDLLHGTIMRSLASPVDNPDAMIVMIQTPLDIEDAIETAFAAAGPHPIADWHCIEASCFELDADGNLQSSWPALFPTDFLLHEKAAAIKANKLSVWMREMEVTVTSRETCSFDPAWLQLHKSLPDAWQELCLTIDPASSEQDTADFQAVALTGKAGNMGWVCAYNTARGQDIDDTVVKFFDTWDFMLKLSNGKANLRFGVEITGYQRQLKRAIEKEMRLRARYAFIEPIQDKRAKEDVINRTLTHVGSNGALHCLESHTEFISDFSRYPRVKHDDRIEAIARGIDMLDLTGQSSAVATGGISRAMAPAVIAASANRIIRGGGLSLGRFGLQRRD
jgi:hypothetical protein